MVYKPKNQYAWKIDKYPVDAQAAGEHIEELDAIHGKITAKILLDDSRPEDALLHPCYEWDDAVAAEKYRLDQSNKIIGNLVVIETTNVEPPAEPVNAFITVEPVNKTAEWRPTIIALSQEETKERVFQNALEQLKALERKYANLVDWSKVLDAYMRSKGKTAKKETNK